MEKSIEEMNVVLDNIRRERIRSLQRLKTLEESFVEGSGMPVKRQRQQTLTYGQSEENSFQDKSKQSDKKSENIKRTSYYSCQPGTEEHIDVG